MISDIDDTILETGVANKAVMLWRLFMEGIDYRPPIPGIAELLTALYRGASGAEHNPLLYVSRAPWTLYEVLDAFFRAQGVPGGPLLFLREWGLRLWRPFPRRGRDHKLVLIRHMMALYRDLPVVLIGDSVQDDPNSTVRGARAPGTRAPIYIRNISYRPERVRAIEAMSAEAALAGASLLLTPSCADMVAHAAGRGLIVADVVAPPAPEPPAEPAAAAPVGVSIRTPAIAPMAWSVVAPAASPPAASRALWLAGTGTQG